MIRAVFSVVLICVFSTASVARADDEKHPPKKKSGKAHSEAASAGGKIAHAFKSVGGHLQKFFTGRDTITR